nr:hypothetical protein [Paenibacillus bovis]
MKLRRFRADFVFIEGHTGIGIAEYSPQWTSGETIAIWSLHYPRKISNKDAFVDILKTIDGELADDEQAIVQMNKYSERKNWHKPFIERVNVRFLTRVRGQMQEAELLAEDAAQRKTDIYERLETE